MTKTITAKQTCLCKSCEGQLFGLLNELKAQAVKQKRCGIVLDAIGDLEISLIEGTIERVQARDKAWSSGRVGRRFHVQLK